jgi:hypothetical protein
MRLPPRHDVVSNCGQQFCVNPLRQPRIDILTWCPNRQARGKALRNAEDGVPNDVPQESVQEEKDQIYDIHDC